MKAIVNISETNNEGLAFIEYTDNNETKKVYASNLNNASIKTGISSEEIANFKESQVITYKFTGKRFVSKNAWQLGQEASWYDNNDVEHPYWYIYDKQTQATSEETYESNQCKQIKKDIQLCETKNVLSV